MNEQRKFGWKRDLPSQTDWPYALHPEFLSAEPLPKKVDHRAEMSPVEDQGPLGSCVAQATGGQLERLQLQAIKEQANSPTVFGPEFKDVSRLFIYFNARAIDGNTNEDAGTYIRSAVMAVRHTGICRESLWPYNPSRVFHVPSSECYEEGAKHKIFAGYRLDHRSEAQLKRCLASGYPFMFGVSLFESFMSREVARTGIVPMPSRREGFLGGHAMLCVGYDEEEKCWIVRNSWNKHWGIDGYCKIPFPMLTGDLAADFWTIRKERVET